MLEIGDSVRIVGGKEVFTIVGTRDPDLFELEFGNDAATKMFTGGSDLELVAKAKKPGNGPGLVPSRSIMD
jgi:hypothetical protein